MVKLPDVNRRGFLAGALLAPAAGAVALPEAAEADVAGADPAGRTRAVTLTQGTDLAVAVSPDGKTLALDVVGVLWVLPIEGGAARRLTDDLFDIGQPVWSPDGSTIAFQAYRDGNFNIWTIGADGNGLRQWTHGPYDHREPQFSPNGRTLLFSSDISGSYGIYTLDLTSGDVATWADTAVEEYEPTWSPDGKSVAFVVANTSIAVVDSQGVRTMPVQAEPTAVLHAPTFSPDGKTIYYTQILNNTSQLMAAGKPVVTGEDVFPFRISWLPSGDFIYTADGVVKRRSGGVVPFAAEVHTTTPVYRKRQRDFTSSRPRQVKGIGSPVLSPDGSSVAFRSLNDIYTMRIGSRPVPLTRDSFWKSDPAWSPDGRWLSYSSDRGGKLDIWLYSVVSRSHKQLTNVDGAAALSASWSRDGKLLAFLDQMGNVYTVEVASGDVRRIFGPLWEPGRPTWSADGSTIALSALKPFSERYREGLSQLLLINRHSGESSYVQPIDYQSLQTRGDDGPVWSPDGTMMAFVIGSVLWVMPVDPAGKPSGPPRQLNGEVTDAPTWSGDSRKLLYLSNARLRLLDVHTGSVRTVPVPMTWANAKSPRRTVIHAGRLWDGTGASVRRNVDIIVEAGRIAAVQPHSAVDGHFVDAASLFVMPGLIDMHNHREMQGYAYGDRQGRLWLSLGFTTTRSPGSPAYHMVEEREAVQSGARIGPRYFATGEAIDGSRIYYNFMRPTYSVAQLELELQRAAALDYDLLKSYVRQRVEWQQRIIEWGHRRGIHATSHYLYPPVALGGDGMEHIGATNRFGYSRTVSALGIGYQDVISLFSAAQAVRTPTLFGAAALFKDDTSLVEDRRVKSLYPAWEYASLQAAVTTAKTTDITAALANLASEVAQIVATLRAGGIVITGTDSPIDHTAVSTHMNLRAMVKYGVTPYQALVTATRAPGEFLQAPIGTVRPGMLADLAIVEGNPLQRIEDAAAVRQVVLGGAVHTVDGLLGPFAAAESTRAAAGSATAAAAGSTVAVPAIPTSRMLPPVPEHSSNARYWWHDEHYIESGRRSCCAG